MQRDAYWMTAILLAALLLACGCSGPGIHGGITDVTDQSPTGRISLEEAMGDLALAESEGMIDLEGWEYVIIHGSDVDSVGNATAWVIGFTSESSFKLLVWDNHGWKENLWTFERPGEPFDPAEAIWPAALFEANLPAIEEAIDAPGTTGTDLDLRDGTWELTVYARDGITILRFDAVTGGMVQ